MPRFSLLYKVLIAYVFILVPILVIIQMIFENNKNETERLLVSELQQAADEREAYILLYLQMNKHRMHDFASDGYIVSTLERMDRKDAGRVLSDYMKTHKLPLLEDMYRLNIITMPDGKVLASTIPGMEGEDLSKEKFFRNGVKGISVDEVVSRFGPEVAVSAPIYSRAEKGKVLGVITGFAMLSKFGEFFTGEYIKSLGVLSYREWGRWETFEVYLVNKDKLMLTQSRFIPDSALKVKVDTFPVRECLEQMNEEAGIYPDYRGVMVVGASKCIPSLGWTLVAEVDQPEVFAPIAKSRRYTFLAVIIVTMLIGALVFYFIRVIVRHLRALAIGAGEIAAGNYNVRVPVRTRDEIGQLASSFNGMAESILERQQELVNSQQSLAESELRYRTLIENLQEGIWVIDENAVTTYVNPRMAEMLGYTVSGMIGGSLFDFMDEEGVRFAKERLERRRMGVKEVVDAEFLKKDGAKLYATIAAAPLMESGKYKGAIAGIVDITERRKAEEALRNSEKSLREAQRIAHIGNWEWDVETGYVYRSEEVFRIFGRQSQEFDSYEKYIDAIHPADREKVIKGFREALEKGKTYSVDARITRGDKTERIVHIQGEVIRDESEKPVRMAGTVQDITERKQAEDEVTKLYRELERRVEERTLELKRANEDLAAAKTEIETFTYSVAHDLRSPLRLIDGFTMLLLKKQRERLDQDGQDHLERIRAASRRMGQLIDDLMNLSFVMRAEVIVSDTIDLSAIAMSIAIDLERAAPERKSNFVIEEGLVAQGDERLLRLVLENLLGNAWKFTSKKDGPRIELRRRGEEDGKDVFCVSDNGVGFDMAHADRLFKPFQRLHSQDEFPGTGIGLVTVKQIVQRHGGRVWAEGEPGSGSVFYFTLQRRKS